MNENQPQLPPTQDDRTPLPLALRKKQMKYYGGAALFALVTIICLCFFLEWEYALGFFGCLFFLWQAYDIKHQWDNGNIVCEQVVCVSAKMRILIRNCMVLTVRKVGAATDDESAVVQYNVPANKKEVLTITSGNLLNIYYAKDYKSELIAWHLLGNEQTEE